MRRALSLFLVVAAFGCERFEHPRYDGHPSETAYVGGGGAAGAVDAPASTCAPSPGGAPPGAACSVASDCAAACCSCGDVSTLLASCVDGICADPDETCALACAPPDSPPTSCGAPFATPSCDSCMTANCCAEEQTCASDASCDALESCEASCADANCDAECESTYGASDTANALDACLVSSCSAECS